MPRTKNIAAAVAMCTIFAVNAAAQRTEISIDLSEQFFDTVIDALFRTGEPPEFSLAAASDGNSAEFIHASVKETQGACRESIRLRRDVAGVQTAVRFRGGKIMAPLAFEGSYNPPLVGCVDFAGWAETVIDLEFDERNQQLNARARVLNVSLNGTGGIGGNVIAKMVQSAIDRKVNPIKILNLSKISFLLPLQETSSLLMNAVGIRHEITDAKLTVFVAYELTRK